MSDLDDDLLALAGGAGDSGEESDGYEPTLSKRSRSEEKDDGAVEDDDDDDEALSSKKRRIDTSDLEFDDDEEDEEDDELVNPYPLEGKYKDEDDRDKLESMDEIQREQILFERTQEMERFNEKKYLQQRMKQQKKLQKQQSGGTAKATRSSNRNKDSNVKTSKLDKLSELRKQREQKSRKNYDDYEDDEEEEEDDDDLRDDEEEDDYEDGVVTWGGASKSKSKRSNVRSNLDDINKIRVGRSLLSKYCFYAFFSDLVIDCFARINLGMDKRTRKPMYRMVKIVDVRSIPEKAYRLNNAKSDLFLKVSQNRKQTKEFPISIFSDSPITPDEFKTYEHELDKTGESIEYQDEATEKYNQIQYYLNKGVSDKDVNEMLEKKRKLLDTKKSDGALTGVDAVFRKSKLLDELKIARQQGDAQKSTAIIEKLKAIEDAMASRAKSSNTSESLNTMSKVNERNRKLNSTNIRKAEIKTKNAVVQFDGGDPFSRLKTVTRMFYQGLTAEENEKALNDARLNLQEKLAEKSKQEEKIATSTYRLLGEMDKLIKTIDIDINLEL
ncbi:plus-3-domain-containing protein [Suhomyces tanzawaensis NRRL Y-17324]|uniref:Plus-3-domain-containing protein n=1 Tax=Suhomyces tanzawaensis NRRL Y-17324 TaxID=984487 RepID=A0A1E4SHT3_9ASCO|nr:plus-3-domain-containing protein [Suhomyces tanzawaensis NRRL Y-17324]ODV79078.1 plus-3-domain-containing protein [Suhomyces tanzawaensis NRRL Y-17324]